MNFNFWNAILNWKFFSVPNDNRIFRKYQRYVSWSFNFNWKNYLLPAPFQHFLEKFSTHSIRYKEIFWFYWVNRTYVVFNLKIIGMPSDNIFRNQTFFSLNCKLRLKRNKLRERCQCLELHLKKNKLLSHSAKTDF